MQQEYLLSISSYVEREKHDGATCMLWNQANNFFEPMVSLRENLLTIVKQIFRGIVWRNRKFLTHARIL